MPSDFTQQQPSNDLFKSASDWLDTLYKPVSQPLGAAAGGVTKALGFSPMWQQAATHFGENLPRLATDIALTSKTGPLKAVGFSDVALQSLGSTADQGFSPMQRLGVAGLQTGAFAAAPKVGEVTGPIAGRMAAPATEALRKVGGVPMASLFHTAAERGGAVAGLLGTMEGANAASAEVLNQPNYWDRMKSPEHLAEMAATTLPFEALGLPSTLRRGFGVADAMSNYRGMWYDHLLKSDAADHAAKSEVLTHQREQSLPVAQEGRPVGDESELIHMMKGFATPLKVAKGEKNMAHHVDVMERLVNDVYGEYLVDKDLPKAMASLRDLRTHFMEVWKGTPKSMKQAALPEWFEQGEVKNRGPFNLSGPQVMMSVFPSKFQPVQVMNTLRNVLTPGEFEWYKQQGIEQQLGGKSSQEVAKWMQEVGPKVEVRKFGNENETSDQDKAQHELETLGWVPIYDDDGNVKEYHRPDGRPVPLNELPGGVRVLHERLIIPRGWESAGGRSGWSSVAPKPESEMPGYVEGAVVVPRTTEKLGVASDASSRMWTESEKQRANELFPSSHSFPPNTLGFFRGYMETTKEGKKVFHVLEVQSDWAQKRREGLQKAREHYPEATTDTEREAQMGSRFLPVDHPLLRDWERLTLKAAVDHAIKEGADAIAVQDAESAMMTEGHDRDVHYRPEVQGGGRLERPVQEKGMRLHYDQTLPRTLGELTGSEGKVVDFGEHQNAVESGPSRRVLMEMPDGRLMRFTGIPSVEGGLQRGGKIIEDSGIIPTQYRPDLIFRNPDGTPKTTTTAREFSLSTVPKDKRWSLFGKDKAPSKPKLMAMERADLGRLESLGDGPNDLVSTAERMAGLDRKPRESLVDFIARKNGLNPDLNKPNDPLALMQDTRQFIRYLGKEVFGWNDEQTGFWEGKALTFAARVGSTQGETRVLPAEAYVQDGQLKASAFYAPSRSGLPNAFIGLYSKSYQRPEMAMFDFFHSLGHELFHGALMQGEGSTFSKWMPEKMREAAQRLNRVSDEMKLTNEEMKQSIQATLRSIAGPQHKGLLDFRSQHYTEDSTGRMEYMADLFGLHAMSAVSPRKGPAFNWVDDMMKYSNDDVREFARGMFRDLGKVWTYLADFLKKAFGWKPGTIKSVEDIVENMKHLMLSAEEGDKSVEAFLQIANIKEAKPWSPTSGIQYDRLHRFYSQYHDPVDPDVKAFAKEVSPMIVPQEDKDLPEFLGAGKRLRWPDYFKALPQLVRTIPEFADLAWLGRNYANMAKESAIGMWSHLNEPGSDRMDLDQFTKLCTTGTGLNKAFSKLSLMQNELSGPNEGQFLTRKEIEATDEYKALSESDKTYFNDVFSSERIGRVHIEAALKNVNSIKWDIAFKVAKVFQAADPKMGWQQAQELGRALTSMHVDTDRLQVGADGRPADEALVKENLAAKELLEAYGQTNSEVLARVNEVFALDDEGKPIDPTQGSAAVKSVVSKFNTYRGKMLGEWLPPDAQNGTWHFRGKPGFTSEVRLGQWVVAWQKKGSDRPSLEGFKSEKEFNQRFTELKRKEGTEVEWVHGHNKEDREDLFKGLRPDMFQDYTNVINSINTRVIETLKRHHPEAVEALSELQSEVQPTAAKTFATLLEAPYMKERRLLGGRETLNMAEGVVHYVSSVAHTVGKRFARGQQSLFLNDPKMKANPQLQKVARQFFNEIVDPSEKGFKMWKTLVAFNYIFFSPSLAFVEATQQLTNHVPALVTQGMTLGNALKSVASANKDMADAWAEGRRRGTKFHIYPNEEEHSAVEWAAKNGVIDRGWLQEVYHIEDDLPFVNTRNKLIGDGTVLDRNGLIGKPLYHLYRFGRDAHGMMITVNTEVAFLSAFRHFRSQGQPYEQALRSSDDVVRESMHGGGRASRPLWYLGVGPGNLGATAGGLMYTLQMYVYNTVGQMARYGYNAMLNSKLSTSERERFATAFATMVGSQMFFAGVMGLPVTSQAFALIEQLFPDSEPKRRAREAFYGAGKWLNSKTHLVGQDEQMGHFVSDAAIDGLMSQVTPWAMGNRFELGPLMGVDPYQGFQWKNVVGPSGSLLEQILLKPAQALSEGHPIDAAIQAFPNSNVRRLLTLASDGWSLRNKEDRKNLDLTQAESAAMAMGFTPKRVADFRAENDMKKRAEKVQSLEQRKFHEKMAGMLQEGQVEEVRAALLDRARTVENYSPRAGAKRVAELLVQREQPYDPLSKGTLSGGTYKIGELFGGQGDALPSATSRLLQENNVVGQLGFPQPTGRSALKVAQLVDSIRQMNPRMSEQEAKALLDHQLHRRKFAF